MAIPAWYARITAVNPCVMHVRPVTMGFVFQAVLDACIARMGFVSEPAPTMNPAAGINVTTEVNLDAAGRPTQGIYVLRTRSAVLAAEHVVIQRCHAVVEVFACRMVFIIAASAAHVTQARCVVSARRGRYMAVMMRLIVLDSAWV